MKHQIDKIRAEAAPKVKTDTLLYVGPYEQGQDEAEKRLTPIIEKLLKVIECQDAALEEALYELFNDHVSTHGVKSISNAQCEVLRILEGGGSEMSYQEISCKKVKARKAHRCEWCTEKIEVGEEYYSRAYKFYGDFNSGHMHTECFAAMEKSDHGQLSDGWCSGEFKRGEVCK